MTWHKLFYFPVLNTADAPEGCSYPINDYLIYIKACCKWGIMKITVSIQASYILNIHDSQLLSELGNADVNLFILNVTMKAEREIGGCTCGHLVMVFLCFMLPLSHCVGKTLTCAVRPSSVCSCAL